VKILSRYIASTYLRMLGLCLGAFIAIYLVVDFLEKIGRFTRADGEWSSIALFFLTRIPEIIYQTAAMAVLMATLLTLGMLSMSSELTAMRGCGISLTRITAPILAIAFGVSLLTLLINELVMPRCNSEGQYIRQVLIEKKSPSTFFRQQNIWYKEENYILKASLFDPASGNLKGITLWQADAEMQPLRRIDARQGELGDSGWLFRDVVIRELAGGNVISTLERPSLAVGLNLKGTDLKVVGKYSDSMGIRELLRYCDKLRKGGYDPTRYLAQMHSRISLSFAPLIMAFLGIPFAMRGGRSSGIALGIGASLGIGFTFFIVNSIILSYGQAGVLPPLVSAWATNFIFIMTGIWLAMRREI
jgi:lipopolysaccharide export system permease protein